MSMDVPRTPPKRIITPAPTPEHERRMRYQVVTLNVPQEVYQVLRQAHAAAQQEFLDAGKGAPDFQDFMLNGIVANGIKAFAQYRQGKALQAREERRVLLPEELDHPLLVPA